MDDVQPWIITKIQDGPLKHLESAIGDPSSSILPLEAFRTQKIQFIHFYSSHQWGSLQPIWAEASDRDVTILVYIPPEVVQRFESNQKADQRPFNQLGFPTFLLGPCCWIWDAPSNTNQGGQNVFKPQLCLKVVLDLSKKSFQLGSVASMPAPSYRSQNNPKQSRELYPLGSALNHNPQWNLLLNKLHTTFDPRLLASTIVSQSNSDNPKVHVMIPHPGTSIRTRASKARVERRQPKLCSIQAEIPVWSEIRYGPGTGSGISTDDDQELNNPIIQSSKKKQPLISATSDSKSTGNYSLVQANQMLVQSTRLMIPSASVPCCQTRNYPILFSSDDYPQITFSTIHSDCCSPSSSAPFALKIKGRRLDKYFD